MPRLHCRVRCIHRSFLQTTAFLCSFYVRIAKPASFSSSTECRIFTPIFCLVPRVSQRVVRIISIRFCADLPSLVVQEMLPQTQIVSSKRRHPNMYTSSTNTGNSTRSNVGTSFGFRQCFRIWIRRRGDCCCRRSPRGDVRQDASLHNDPYWQMWFGSDSWVYSGLSRCIWLRGCLVPRHVQVGIVFLVGNICSGVGDVVAKVFCSSLYRSVYFSFGGNYWCRVVGEMVSYHSRRK